MADQDIIKRARAEADIVRTSEALRQHNRALALLNQAGQELTATHDLQQVLKRLLQAATDVIGAEDASVWLRDEEQAGWLTCKAATSNGQESPLINLRLRPGQGVVGWVTQNETSTIVSSAPDDPRFFSGVDEQTGLSTTSLLAVPMRLHGPVVGVLEVVNKLNGEFDTDDLALVEMLAASAAIAIENARLVEALHQRTVELQARNEELDAFAHTVAHDLKGPLSHIVGFAEVLNEKRASVPEQDLHRHLRAIARNGRKMSNIINELLLLAGVREMEVETRPLDMPGIVAEARQRLAYAIEEHQAEVIVLDTWPLALGHGPWVEEVWVNYISNALKYGGQPARVELGATAQPDGTVCFWVRDNGPGIAPREQDRLFTRFTRLDQIHTQGHGLGLSIVRRIVKKLGGKVGVESEPGEGSTFWFTLPAADCSGGLIADNLHPIAKAAEVTTLVTC